MKRTTADTNLFIQAADPDSPHHAVSRQFFDEASLKQDDSGIRSPDRLEGPQWRHAMPAKNQVPTTYFGRTRFYPSFAAKKSMVRLQASLAAAGL